MFTILLKESGLYPKNLFYLLKGFPVYIKNKALLKKQLKTTNAPFKIAKLYPQLTDRFDTSGSFPLHYFYQDLYVAQRVFNNLSVKHVEDRSIQIRRPGFGRRRFARRQSRSAHDPAAAEQALALRPHELGARSADGARWGQSVALVSWIAGGPRRRSKPMPTEFPAGAHTENPPP